MKCTAKSDTGANMETQRLFNAIPSPSTNSVIATYIGLRLKR